MHNAVLALQYTVLHTPLEEAVPNQLRELHTGNFEVNRLLVSDVHASYYPNVVQNCVEHSVDIVSAPLRLVVLLGSVVLLGKLRLHLLCRQRQTPTRALLRKCSCSFSLFLNLVLQLVFLYNQFLQLNVVFLGHVLALVDISDLTIHITQPVSHVLQGCRLFFLLLQKLLVLKIVQGLQGAILQLIFGLLLDHNHRGRGY